MNYSGFNTLALLRRGFFFPMDLSLGQKTFALPWHWFRSPSTPLRRAERLVFFSSISPFPPVSLRRRFFSLFAKFSKHNLDKPLPLPFIAASRGDRCLPSPSMLVPPHSKRRTPRSSPSAPPQPSPDSLGPIGGTFCRKGPLGLPLRELPQGFAMGRSSLFFLTCQRKQKLAAPPFIF